LFRQISKPDFWANHPLSGPEIATISEMVDITMFCRGRAWNGGTNHFVEILPTCGTVAYALSGFNLAIEARIVVAFVPVVFPLQRLQIAEIVSSTLCNGLDVIDFPPQLFRFSVPAPLHTCSADIFAEARIRGLRSSLLPHGLDGLFIEGPSLGRRIWISCHTHLSLPSIELENFVSGEDRNPLPARKWCALPSTVLAWA